MNRYVIRISLASILSFFPFMEFMEWRFKSLENSVPKLDSAESSSGNGHFLSSISYIVYRENDMDETK